MGQRLNILAHEDRLMPVVFLGNPVNTHAPEQLKSQFNPAHIDDQAGANSLKLFKIF